MKNDLIRLKDTLQKVQQKQINVLQIPQKPLMNFKDKQLLTLQNQLNTALKSINTENLFQYALYDKSNHKVIELLKQKVQEINFNYTSNEISKTIAVLDQAITLFDQLKVKKSLKLDIIPSKIPAEIREEVLADLTELENCYNANCFRSAIILCGRILESALHRKYYDATGVDILEKSPGIGLGNLIAKLVEKNVSFDPGITQQIHLINQVRIFSVHKKTQSFYPTAKQAKAIILFTLDTLSKIF